MKYLADTQIVIWTLIKPEKITADTKTILENQSIFVSHISLFEIAIKQKLGKLPELDITISRLADLIERDGFNLLPLQTIHIDTYHSIPLLPEHRDPFDRLLLATAISENMPLISADAHFKNYLEFVRLVFNG